MNEWALVNIKCEYQNVNEIRELDKCFDFNGQAMRNGVTIRPLYGLIRGNSKSAPKCI
jgi:hypothetical protein